PNEVAKEYTALAREYRCGSITGDNFAGEWVAQAFKKAGIEYRKSKLSKSKLYLEGLPIFNRHAVSIPDYAPLLRELRLLERSTHRSGQDSVDHPRHGSDDLANSLFGAMQLALQPITRPHAVSGTWGSADNGVSYNGAFYHIRGERLSETDPRHPACRE